MALINQLIGEFGRYQFFICVLIFLSKITVGFHQLAIIFLAPPASYTCPVENATLRDVALSKCCEDPIYDKSIFSRTIVMEWHLVCSRGWLKDFTQTLFQFGVLIGSLLSGIASDRYGRRPTLLICVIIQLFTGVMASFLPDYWSFTIIRMLLGVSVGGIMVVGFVIIMEFVGNKNRELVSALYQMPFTVGLMILSIIGYFIRDYVYLQLAISAGSVVLLSYICFLPETPRWLLAVDRVFPAIELMERVAKTNNLPTENLAHEVEMYHLEHRRTRANEGNVLDLFRTPNIRKNLLVMSFLWFACSTNFYGVAQYISTLTGDIYINVLATGGVCTCSCVIGIPLLKFYGRKTIVSISFAICSVCFFIIAFLHESYLTLTIACIGDLFCYLVFLVIYLYCTELFPTVVRNAAIGISSMMARVGAMLAPFAAALKVYGEWQAPLVFTLFPLVAAFLTLLLPETKDCELMTTIEEGEAFGKRVPQIVHTTDESDDDVT